MEKRDESQTGNEVDGIDGIDGVEGGIVWWMKGGKGRERPKTAHSDLFYFVMNGTHDYSTAQHSNFDSKYLSSHTVHLALHGMEGRILFIYHTSMNRDIPLVLTRAASGRKRQVLFVTTTRRTAGQKEIIFFFSIFFSVLYI